MKRPRRSHTARILLCVSTVFFVSAAAILAVGTASAADTTYTVKANLNGQ
jgi:hypothetical protein